MSHCLVQDQFTVREIDPDGKHFSKGTSVLSLYVLMTMCLWVLHVLLLLTRVMTDFSNLFPTAHVSSPPLTPALFCSSLTVSRLVAVGENYEMDMVCDFHCELYPIRAGEKLDVILASTLNDNGLVEKGTPAYDPNFKSTLLDDFEYVMHGKVFKIKQPSRNSPKIEVFVSYGGLLMSLKGESKNLRSIDLDMNLYLLMKKRTM